MDRSWEEDGRADSSTSFQSTNIPVPNPDLRSPYHPGSDSSSPSPLPASSRRDTSASLGVSLDYYLGASPSTSSSGLASPSGAFGELSPIGFDGARGISGGVTGSGGTKGYSTLEEDGEEFLLSDDKGLRSYTYRRSGYGMDVDHPAEHSNTSSALPARPTPTNISITTSTATTSSHLDKDTDHQHQANIYRRMHVLDIPPTPSTGSPMDSVNNSVIDLGRGCPLSSPMEYPRMEDRGSSGQFQGASARSGRSIPGRGGRAIGLEEDANSSASEYSTQASPVSSGLLGGFGYGFPSSSSSPGRRGSDERNNHAMGAPFSDGSVGEDGLTLEDWEDREIMRERQRIVSQDTVKYHAGGVPGSAGGVGEATGMGRDESSEMVKGTTRPLSLRPTGGSGSDSGLASASSSNSGAPTSKNETRITDLTQPQSLNPHPKTHLRLPLDNHDRSSASSGSSGSTGTGKIPRVGRMAFLAPPDVSPGSLDEVEQAIQGSADDYMSGKHGAIGGVVVRDRRETARGAKDVSEKTVVASDPIAQDGGLPGEEEMAKSAPAWTVEFTDTFSDVGPSLSLNSPNPDSVRTRGHTRPIQTESKRSSFNRSANRPGSGAPSSVLEHPFFSMKTTSPPMVRQDGSTFSTEQTYAPSETAGPVMMAVTSGERSASKRIPSPKKLSVPLSPSTEDGDGTFAADSSPSLQSISSFGTSGSSLTGDLPRSSPGLDNLPSRSSSRNVTAVRGSKGSLTKRPELLEASSSYSSRSSVGVGYSMPSKPSTEQIAAKLEHSMQRFSVQTLRRPASLRSLRSQSSLDISGKRGAGNSTANRPWPAAMLFGNVKALRSPGLRAEGYAKAIRELNASDSGLREWQENAGRKSKAPAAPRDRKRSKMIPMSELGRRTSVASSRPESYAPTIRNVSGGSDVFPMRPDATVAKEITVQLVDPADPPNALPANLPYPQLQAIANASGSSSGIKASPSMSSVKSIGGGFGLFSKVGRFTGSKKAKELSAYNQNLSPVSDVQPRGNRQSIDSLSSDRQQGVIGVGGTHAPAGPRDRTSISSQQDRRNSFRSSIDRDRGGGDRPRQRNSMSAQTQTQVVKAAISGPMSLRREDVTRMTDVLPGANPTVLEAYLKREGDQIQAIGAYIEDEKAGRPMQA